MRSGRHKEDRAQQAMSLLRAVAEQVGGGKAGGSDGSGAGDDGDSTPMTAASPAVAAAAAGRQQQQRQRQRCVYEALRRRRRRKRRGRGAKAATRAAATEAAPAVLRTAARASAMPVQRLRRAPRPHRRRGAAEALDKCRAQTPSVLKIKSFFSRGSQERQVLATDRQTDRHYGPGVTSASRRARFTAAPSARGHR